jgi:hypothetical protein
VGSLDGRVVIITDTETEITVALTGSAVVRQPTDHLVQKEVSV